MSNDHKPSNDLTSALDKVLEVSPKATQQQIRDAYKK
jgi:DnaJ-class molecular chaperone